jgi:hypothetical protein
MAANNIYCDRLAEMMAVQNPSPSINDSAPGRILDRVLDSLNERERTRERLEPTNQQEKLCRHPPKLSSVR